MQRDAEADLRRVQGSAALTGRAERGAVGARIVAGYLAQPQTDEELAWAREGAERVVAAEPW